MAKFEDLKIGQRVRIDAKGVVRLPQQGQTGTIIELRAYGGHGPRGGYAVIKLDKTGERDESGVWAEFLHLVEDAKAESWRRGKVITDFAVGQTVRYVGDILTEHIGKVGKVTCVFDRETIDVDGGSENAHKGGFSAWPHSLEILNEEEDEMKTWNGMKITPEAFAIAETIYRATNLFSLLDGFNIAEVKTDLRRLYVATGGVRRKYDPTAKELRGVYNGEFRGADLMAARTGRMAEEAKTEEAPQWSKAEPTETADGETDQVAKALAQLLGKPKIDAAQIAAIAERAVSERIDLVTADMPKLISEAVAKAVRKVEIQVAELPSIEIDCAHKALESVVRYAANRRNILLVGPAGSGKTTLATQVATALGLPFYMSGKVADETKLTGFIDAGGTYRSTAFRRAYETGGVFLFDEMDGSAPDALVAFNAPLAGNLGDFPDGMIQRHPDFVAIGAANTFGRGADRQYVGREQLDAATLDRFAVIEIDYDEDLETAISSNADWTAYVQKVRAAVAKEKVRHIVSPRASIDGGVMLAAGADRKEVEEAFIWKGLEEPTRNRVLAALR